MEILFNNQKVMVHESMTFQQLFQQMGIYNTRDQSIHRNGMPFLMNPNNLIKNILQPNDQISTVVNIKDQTNGQPMVINPPYRLQANTTPILSQSLQSLQNQQFNPQLNQQFRATNVVTNFTQQQNYLNNGNQYVMNPQIGLQSQTIQPKQQLNLQQQQQLFQQSIPQTQPVQQNINQINQNVPQIQKQNEDVFATDFFKNDQEEVDVFSTVFQFSNYDEQRLKYLENRNISPGDKQQKYERDNYIFTLDNYGDELIIQKNDQSFYLKVNSSFKMNKQRQIDIQSKEQFDKNIIFYLNYTRLAWIQNMDILAVQFNNGNKIFLKLYME